MTAETAGARGDEGGLVLRGERGLEPRGGDGGALPVTRGMKVALFAGASVFTVGTLIQLIVIAWLALAAGITAMSGTILAHTGGLEPKTFATCVKAAIVLDAVLLLAIVGAWVTRVGRRELGQDPGGYYVRSPVRTTAAWLLVGLVAVTLAGWQRSVFFPYPLVTIVVLANAYFFALVGLIGLARLADRAWEPIRSWAELSPYRTGFLTATLVLLGTAGLILRGAHWYERPARQLAAELELDRVRGATGFVDAQLRGLCVAAEETAPQLAHGDAAPACGFLTDGAAPDDGGTLGASGGAAGGSGGSDGTTSALRASR